MHFKYQLWDFPNQFKADFRTDFDGVLAINTFDDVSLKIVKENILRHFSKEKIIYKIANEIKKDWIQDEFETISMFKDSESFFIHQSDDFSRDFIDLIGNIKISSRLVILSFQKKQATWKKLHQDSKIVTLSIETPKFWESNKALDFFCRYFSLQISYDAKSWMIEIFGNDLASFYNACFLLKINHPLPENLSLTHVQKHFVNERVDHFLMASLFSRKKMLDYYEKIILVQNDFEKLRSFFSFMQSHLLKVLDPSYL
jgi:hypothetical protein